jgi:hypothetical protein
MDIAIIIVGIIGTNLGMFILGFGLSYEISKKRFK